MAELTTLLPGDPVRQFSVMLANRAGSFERLMRLLKKNHIELLGISMQDSRDATVARIVVSDPDLTEQVFLERGIPHTTSELLVVALRDSGAELIECLHNLHLAETNIDFTYSLLPHPEGLTLVAFHLEDLEFGRSVLHTAGFKVMSQKDLSR
jgi:hypothetical protein